MSAPRYWLDGEPATQVPVDDRGLLLADGAFETLWWTGGRCRYVAFHRHRLSQSLTVLRFPQPEHTANVAINQLLQILEEQMPDVSGVVRLTVTRGAGPRGYRPPLLPEPRSIVGFFPAAPAGFCPLKVGCSEVRWSRQSAWAGSKLLARTEQVVAAALAGQHGLDDVLMEDDQGHVISSSCANLMVRVGSTLLLPDLSESGIAGTRLAVIKAGLAKRHGLTLRTSTLSRADLLAADELLLCNAVRGTQSIADLAGHVWHDFALGHALHEDMMSGVSDAA